MVILMRVIIGFVVVGLCLVIMALCGVDWLALTAFEKSVLLILMLNCYWTGISIMPEVKK